MTLYSWFVRGREHAQMCQTSVDSVLRVDPDATCLVMTDEERHDWRISGAQIRTIAPGLPIMVANLEAQISALDFANQIDALRVVFLDTDILVLRAFPPDHAVGAVNFTWRDNVGVSDDGEKVEGVAARMPYNYGVIMARPGLSALECFIWMRERVRAMQLNYQEWYGNQLAAAELAGRRPDAGTSYTTREIPWRICGGGKKVLIGKLPCTDYNYTPSHATENVTGKFALHFKGHKRHLMPEYAQRLGLKWYAPIPKNPEMPALDVVTAL
jgi:hypothetical protein